MNWMIKALNQLELINHAFHCVRYRLYFHLQEEQFIKLETFAQATETYLNALNKEKSWKYESNVTKTNEQVFAILMDDIINSIRDRITKADLLTFFINCKDASNRRNSKIKSIIRLLDKYRKRQLKSEYWRLKRKIRDMYPRETILHKLSSLFLRRDWENLRFSFDKIYHSGSLQRQKLRNIERARIIIEEIAKRNKSKLFRRQEAIAAMNTSRLIQSSKTYFPLILVRVEQSKKRDALFKIMATNIPLYLDKIKTKQLEIKWYRSEIKKRQYHRNFSSLIEYFKTWRNRRLSDSFRKMILSLAKKRHKFDLANVLDKMYLKRILIPFQLIHLKSKEVKIKTDERRKKGIKEGFILLDMFVKDKLNQAFSTIKMLVHMYEVLEIHEVTQKKLLASGIVQSYIQGSSRIIDPYSANSRIILSSDKASRNYHNTSQASNILENETSNIDILPPMTPTSLIGRRYDIGDQDKNKTYNKMRILDKSIYSTNSLIRERSDGKGQSNDLKVKSSRVKKPITLSKCKDSKGKTSIINPTGKRLKNIRKRLETQMMSQDSVMDEFRSLSPIMGDRESIQNISIKQNISSLKSQASRRFLEKHNPSKKLISNFEKTRGLSPSSKNDPGMKSSPLIDAQRLLGTSKGNATNLKKSTMRKKTTVIVSQRKTTVEKNEQQFYSRREISSSDKRLGLGNVFTNGEARQWN